MQMRSNVVKKSLLLSAGSFFVTVLSITLSQFISHLNYLFFFNLLAIVLVVLAVAALFVGAGGLWRSRRKEPRLWAATLLPAIWLWMVLAFG